MTWNSFGAFFEEATRKGQPFPYQTQMAVAPKLPKLLHAQTSAGKTAAATLGWLWRRRFHPDSGVRQSTPRRLVYCLPMRILVEQTRDAIATWLDNLGIADLPVHILMGGEADDDWIIYPDREAILIGTQDMLLSRALNRGYGLSRFRWPQAFALLHNDAFWVFDEVQLFGVGLPTTLQLEAFRSRATTYGPTPSLWMSATMQPSWFQTVDFSPPGDSEILRLGPEDLAFASLKQRMHAHKPLGELSMMHNPKDIKAYAKELAATVSQNHQPGTMTLVIMNTVKRAQAVFSALREVRPTNVLLLHSRFRPEERAELIKGLSAKDLIVVSTQVVEAGVDISARALFTEVAPWASLVQRFGRCNRLGERTDATIFWIDLEEKQLAPYSRNEIAGAREQLRVLQGRSVAPAELPEVPLPQERGDVLRWRDMVDLFDTTPDLSGNDLDVSRFIRVSDDHDVLLCWRPFADYPAPDMAEPHRSELCGAPLSEVREFLKGKRAWVFDHLDDRWKAIHGSDIRPGLLLVLPTTAGGYSRQLGWDPGSTETVAPVFVKEPKKPEATGDDTLTNRQTWQELLPHTDDVVQELDGMLAALAPESAVDSALRRAARWHDAGKAHAVFQTTLLGKAPEQGAATVWAKAPTGRRRHGRPHFRHELASAIAMLQVRPDDFLAVYLVGAHHGRVRLSIRSVDGEKLPDGNQKGGRYALGIWDGDPLGPVDLGGWESLPGLRLDLSPIELGANPGSSQHLPWTEQAVDLRDQYGPFRLAYLEALLRAADSRASKQAREGEMT